MFVAKNDCSSAPCFANHCQELEAGYRCYCPAGYTLAADKHTCQGKSPSSFLSVPNQSWEVSFWGYLLLVLSNTAMFQSFDVPVVYSGRGWLGADWQEQMGNQTLHSTFFVA